MKRGTQMSPRARDMIKGLVKDPDTLMTREEFEASFELDNDDYSLDDVFDFFDDYPDE